MTRTRQAARSRPPASREAPLSRREASVGNQARLRRLADGPGLRIGDPAAAAEHSADRAAAQVMKGAGPVSLEAGGADGQPASTAVQDAVAGLGPGAPLPASERAFFEPRFGRSLGDVRVHDDAPADRAARAVAAPAFALGPDLAFAAGRFQPGTAGGRRLLAHELAHTLQRGGEATIRRGGDYYSPAERKAMSEGKVTGQQADKDMARARGFEKGDIVFRMGDKKLAFLIDQPVTHGGIYLGDGVIHDVVAFGNRHVRVSQFYNPDLGEAADGTIYRVIRFKGPERGLILERLLSNIARRDFDMPTGKVPFNLFSSAKDYETATCLEYAHAQFLHAIRQLAADQTVGAGVRETLRKTYFTGAAEKPNALIKPKEQAIRGYMPTPNVGAGGMGGMGGLSGMGGLGGEQRSLGAKLIEGGLIGAANLLGRDADPTRNFGRSESEYRMVYANSGTGWRAALANFNGPLYDEVVLSTFTYGSFKDSSRFFEDRTPAADVK